MLGEQSNASFLARGRRKLEVLDEQSAASFLASLLLVEMTAMLANRELKQIQSWHGHCAFSCSWPGHCLSAKFTVLVDSGCDWPEVNAGFGHKIT